MTTTRHALPAVTLLLALGTSTAACGLFEGAPDHDGARHAHGAHDGHATTPALSDGTRFEADPITHDGVLALHATVQTLRERGDVTPTDVDDLRDAYLAIFRDCTMEGPAHDALHDVLVPLDDDLERLRGGDDGALADLDAHLAVYATRFEGP